MSGMPSMPFLFFSFIIHHSSQFPSPPIICCKRAKWGFVMAKGKSKKPAQAKGEKVIRGMGLVTFDGCEGCKTPCGRGMAYAGRMRGPGAVGKGVPCNLNKK